MASAGVTVRRTCGEFPGSLTAFGQRRLMTQRQILAGLTQDRQTEYAVVDGVLRMGRRIFVPEPATRDHGGGTC